MNDQMPDNIHVLLVEDDPEYGAAMQTALESRTLATTLARSAEDALPLLRKQWQTKGPPHKRNGAGFDIVVADIRLAGMSGVDLLREIRKERPDYPVILLTGYADQASMIDAVRLGAQDYILKSDADRTNMAQRIEKAVDTHRLTTLNQKLVSELLLAEGSERHRIADELHGGVCPDMAAISLRLSALLMTEQLPQPVHDELETILAMATHALGRLRLTMHSLSPPTLREMGLKQALKSLVMETGRSHNLSAKFEGSGPPAPMDMNTCSFLYRVVQELLTNTVTHAKASAVTVSLFHSGEFAYVQVTDNGQGFEVTTLNERMHAGPHLGLQAIRGRLRMLGGDLSLSSELGRGTETTACVPMTEHTARDTDTAKENWDDNSRERP